MLGTLLLLLREVGLGPDAEELSRLFLRTFVGTQNYAGIVELQQF